ncbi:MAG: 5'/3'-nucleotidase SurE [Actinomycetia bacterium]|nr:5'/3'-nucleotidase SurE [Actinomycetes bacterium]
MQRERMVLVTNDDGITAPGLRALVQVLEELGITHRVVAPASDQSGRSHAVTLTGSLVVRDADPQPGWTAVVGTPVDCVRVALARYGPTVAAVLAGVNRGHNLGAHILASGTVAAAREAAVHGLPGLALSASSHPDWSAVVGLLRRHLPGWMAYAEGRPGTWLNVNLPDRSDAPWRWAVLDPRPVRVSVDAAVPSRQVRRVAYRLADPPRDGRANASWDTATVAAGAVAVTAVAALTDLPADLVAATEDIRRVPAAH